MFYCGLMKIEKLNKCNVSNAGIAHMCISEKEISSRGHLAICVYVYDYTNIIMCIGLVYGIFMGNI